MKQKFSRDDIEMLSQHTVYQGFFRVDEYRFKHRLFAGGWSEPVTREVFERGHAVVVLPYDPVSDKVVLIEQIRIPVVADASTPWLFELVAGMIEPGESAEQVAHRELREEAGLVANKMVRVCDYFASPGGSSERFDFYWAKVDASLASGIHGISEEHEDIKVHVMSREAAYQLLCDGVINNASTMIGLQWLQLNYHKLREGL
ncbi:ADP-ribose diphosphatase [Shewanella algidipiscicola]|uniref:ADP-ribose pyrophosphatase n=1 Tax=Shewanella algidipiscicola TaxID=614070 RepID=A0ABQ4PCN7_9GAMM|nr:ADP-ribose diphosphatase [Shewanella algidipiscicola]GIU45318.1 ADP-ribose pyrophosphatase [Shewanella algidipiscicola]